MPPPRPDAGWCQTAPDPERFARLIPLLRAHEGLKGCIIQQQDHRGGPGKHPHRVALPGGHMQHAFRWPQQRLGGNRHGHRIIAGHIKVEPAIPPAQFEPRGIRKITQPTLPDRPRDRLQAVACHDNAAVPAMVKHHNPMAARHLRVCRRRRPGQPCQNRQ